MTLLLAVAGITNASAWWVGNSAVNLNGYWYYCGTNLNWCTGGAFDGADLGTITSLQLGGQSQVYADGYQWDYNSDGGEYGIKMGYKIDGIYVESQVITFQKIDYRDNNNICQSGGSDFSTVSIDISNLHPGEHTIEVWFVSNNVWDSNNSQNYKATFTISSGPVNYLKADGTTGTETATLLTGSETTIGSESAVTWYVVTGIVKYTDEVNIKGTVNLILADECEMNMGTDTHPINGTAIWVDSDIPGNLTIYGQEDGTGNLTIYATGRGISTRYDGYITINGGIVNTIDDDSGIYTGNFTINGGTLITSSQGAGIEVDQNITINGGSINATGNIGIISNGGNITITYGSVIAIGHYLYGINANDITIEGGEINATGWDAGIYAKDVTIEGGEITASGKEEGIYAYNNINIYGGTITASGEEDGIYASEGDITISGGTVIANGDERGIFTAEGNIAVKGGTVTATGGDYGNIRGIGISIFDGTVNATNSAYGIYAGTDDGNINIYGGTVNITGNVDALRGRIINICGGVVSAYDSNIYTENITLNGGTVTSSSYNGTVKVASGFTYTDGTNYYDPGHELTDIEIDALNSASPSKTLQPSSANLTANSADGNYWSTFYFGSKGFTIDEGVNAFAYTATYGLNSETNEYEITLHKLGEDGKSIPEGTAVIIVSSTASVSMTPNDNLGKFSGTNNLHGVDVATATSVITSELGQGTIFVLGKTPDNDDFGFHKYIGATMPARKAFLLIPSPNEALARGISVVFDDDSTTGIKAVNREERIVNSDDAWFDLQGRKIQEPTQRGLYIHNGKKIVVK